MAYQIAFDLEDNATQEFLQKVGSELPVTSTSTNTHEKSDSEAMETDDQEYVIMLQ
jgi:hypothetical protein